MSKKSNFLILVIVLLVVVIGFMAYSNFFQEKSVHVGDLNFEVPKGYHEGVLNHLGDVNLTDGSHSICIGKYSDDNIQKYVKNYVNERTKNNDTIKQSTTTIDNQQVYKAENKNTGATHYWFVSNGKVYTIYSWDKVDNMDEIVSNLVKSMHP